MILHMHMFICVHVCGSQRSALSISQLVPGFLFEAGPLTKPEAYWSG